MIRHFINLVLLLLPPSRLFGLRNALLRMSGTDIHHTSKFCGRSWIYGRGRLSIGADTWISPGAIIHTHPEAAISIGRRCDIGPSVEFVPGSHVIGNRMRRAGEGVARPITVGDGCWVGARCVILGGVTVGEGSVLAAGAVVTQDVPAHTLVAGIPARIKRNLST